MATLIIDEAKGYLPKDLSKTIYVTLTDHLNFAIERQKQGIEFSNALSWEIKKFYPQEYAAGKKAVEIVRQQTGINLPESEIASIALHFINAEVGGSIHEASIMPEMVKEILNIVTYSMLIELDENSVNYERFITHLKYFIIRAIRNECYEEDEPPFFENIIEAYPEEFQCALRIKSIIEKKIEYAVSNEELMYLTAHINRVKRRSK